MYVLIDDMFPLRSLIVFSSEETSGGACGRAVSVRSVLLEKAPVEDFARIEQIDKNEHFLDLDIDRPPSFCYKTNHELGDTRGTKMSTPVSTCPGIEPGRSYTQNKNRASRPAGQNGKFH